MGEAIYLKEKVYNLYDSLYSSMEEHSAVEMAQTFSLRRKNEA